MIRFPTHGMRYLIVACWTETSALPVKSVDGGMPHFFQLLEARQISKLSSSVPDSCYARGGFVRYS
jgi:hypothetical protein